MCNVWGDCFHEGKERSVTQVWQDGVGMHAHETHCSLWGVLMVGPNMDCFDPAVYYVDKKVKNELVDCTKSLISLCLC